MSGLIGGPGSGEAKQILGGIGDVVNFLGLGLKKGHKKGSKATPRQLEALARGRATRDANRRLKNYRGSALLPAGY